MHAPTKRVIDRGSRVCLIGSILLATTFVPEVVFAQDAIISESIRLGKRVVGVKKFTLSCPFVDISTNNPYLGEQRVYTFHIVDLNGLRTANIDLDQVEPGTVYSLRDNMFGFYAFVSNPGWQKLLTSGDGSTLRERDNDNYWFFEDEDVGTKGCITASRYLNKVSLKMTWVFERSYDLDNHDRRCRRAPTDITVQCELIDYRPPPKGIGF